jgi:O-antigen/teichoic acid export membrane protein
MSIGRHTIYNLAGSIVPMFISIVTVPIYLHFVGNTRYGILALVWMFLGYFGVFDPGIGRAASYHIARLHDGPARDREDIFWTALIVNLGFGVAGGLLLYLVAQPLFVSTFKMPPALRAEVIASLPWLAASIPISIVGNVLGGVLQARDRFGISNTISILNSFLSQTVPLAVAYLHGPELTWLIPAILFARTFGFIPNFWAVARALPLGTGGRFKPALVKTLFSYGGWVAVTSLLNPLLTSMDRFLIGSILNVNAVAYYTVAANLSSKVSVIPGALAASLFPKLSRGTGQDADRLASNAVISLAAVTTPLIVAGLVAMPIFMNLWVGAAFAAHAVPVATILLLGMWINGLAFIPYGHLQARNRPDIVAKFHTIEVIPFLTMLWLGSHFYGLIGAAWATTLRVTIDAILLFAVAGRLQGWQRVIPGGALIIIAPFCAPSHILSLKLICAVTIIIISLVWALAVAPLFRNLNFAPKPVSLTPEPVSLN